MVFRLRNIAPGETGTDQTISLISQLVNDSLKRPDVRLLTHGILRRLNLSSRNEYRSALAIYNWVCKNIRYVKDPVDVETVQAPEVTLSIKAGDCDDHVVLIASMLQSVGIPVRYQVMGKDRDRFSHVFIESLLDSRWTPVDTTISGPMGRSGGLPLRKVYDHNGRRGVGCYSVAPALAGIDPVPDDMVLSAHPVSFRMRRPPDTPGVGPGWMPVVPARMRRRFVSRTGSLSGFEDVARDLFSQYAKSEIVSELQEESFLKYALPAVGVLIFWKAIPKLAMLALGGFAVYKYMEK